MTWGYLAPTEDPSLRFALKEQHHYLGRDVGADGGTRFLNAHCSSCRTAEICNSKHAPADVPAKTVGRNGSLPMQTAVCDRMVSSKHCKFFVERVHTTSILLWTLLI